MADNLDKYQDIAFLVVFFQTLRTSLRSDNEIEGFNESDLNGFSMSVELFSLQFTQRLTVSVNKSTKLNRRRTISAQPNTI